MSWVRRKATRKPISNSPSYPAPQQEPSSDGVSSSPVDSANRGDKPAAGQLKYTLQEELRRGDKLRQRLHHQGIARVGGPMIAAPVTEADVVWWEDRVADLFKSEPLMLARFLSDPVESHVAALTSGFSVLYGRLDRRLEHRLTMLGQIIRGL